MFDKLRFIILVTMVLLVALTGCAGTVVENPITPVDSETVTVKLHYIDGPEVGPPYDVSVTVPSDWVGQFNIRNVGNSIYFDYLRETGTDAEIFFIEALSEQQFWEQDGSFPGNYTNIVNRGDTYFIYHLPIDAYYSGLPDEEFMAFSEAVPGVIASFTAEEAN